jgi:hypothetical protein
MIGEAYASAQIMRLGVLDGFPREGFIGALAARAALKELVQALQCADSEAIAKDVIDVYFWPTAGKDCPKPADIRRACNERDPQEVEPWRTGPPPETCHRCGGWGTVGTPPHKRWCSCEAGERLAEEIPGWLDLANAPPLKRAGLRRVHPSWLESGSRVRMASERVGRQ